MVEPLATALAAKPDDGSARVLGRADVANLRARLSAMMAQTAVRRSLPLLGGMGALAVVGALYLGLSRGPERTLYSQLSDSERAQVVEALEGGGIAYSIDSGTGMITVPEADLYRARMVVASNGALAAPESGGELLDSIPLGASRTLEGERLRLARERELMLTIVEIDGIEAARVHLATPDRSVFLRESTEPSASVMVRLARGKRLDPDQVDAIVNLVAGSVPGMKSGAVRVVDQNGQLLSAESDAASGTLALQREFEDKLRGQLAKLLVPLLGEGNFSSEVQIELNREELTSARESYDPENVVQRESESNAISSGGGAVGGIPGVLSNQPPPPTQLVEQAPQGTQPGIAGAPTSDSQTSAQRDFAVGREVAVSSVAPGGIARISVGVAVSDAALKKIAPANPAQLQSLIEAAVGANAERGDRVTVMVGKFEPVAIETPAFHETPWFATVLRYGAALVAVLLALLLGVRPLLSILRGDRRAHSAEDGDDAAGERNDKADHVLASSTVPHRPAALAAPANLREQVALAQQLAIEQPDRAVGALRRMLAAPGEKQP